MESFDLQWSVAIDLIRYSHHIVAFTGAGISTDSGIADFRSPGGLWEKYNPLIYANYTSFLKNPKPYWELERALVPIFADAKPNRGHRALVELEKKGKLSTIITQNIDNFHQLAGNKVPIIELHGNVYQAYCLDCGKTIKRGYVLKQLKSEDKIPICPYCGGRVKTGAILFNEPVADELIDSAIHAAQQSDLFLILGSSLIVFPANQILVLAKKAGAKLIIINKEPTQMDKYCDLRFLGNISEILPRLVADI